MVDTEINWWEIGDDQNLHLNSEELELLRKSIVENYNYLSVFGKGLSLGAPTLYNKFKYKNQGITVSLLKRILHELNTPLEKIGRFPIKVGKEKLVEARFPIKINHFLGEILANTFFDGYADNYTIRYSNYDEEIRNEFCLCVNNFIERVEIPINKPRIFRRDVDLPSFVPKLLKSILSIDTFLGDRCRVPEQFIKLVEKEKKLGWCFLKGAYLDEGTTTNGEIFILTGIKNKLLVEDTEKIAKILGLSTSIRIKHGYYNLRLHAESFERFYNNISNLFFTQVNKWSHVFERVQGRWMVEGHGESIKEDCTKILEVCERNGRINLDEVKQVCNLPKSTAYFRINLLFYNGNLDKKRVGMKNEYVLKTKDLSSLPNMNEMRRMFGWR